MRIAASSIAWPATMNEEVASLMAEFSIDGVEIAPTAIAGSREGLTIGAAERVRAFWDGKGIQIPSMQGILFGAPHCAIFEGPELQQKLRHSLQEIFAIAAVLGASKLVFGSPKNRLRGAIPLDRAIQIAAEFFKVVGDDAAKAGVTLCIEHVPPELGADFINTYAEGLRLVDAIAHPNIALHIDSAALRIMGDAFSEAIPKSAGRFAHFHASERGLAPLGSGFVDHAAAGAELKKIGYPGWVSIEMRQPEDPLAALRRAFEITTRCYG